MDREYNITTLCPTFTMTQRWLTDFDDDTPSSLTLNAETLIHTQLCSFSQSWALSVSLDERITLMEEFISTLLWTSAESIQLEMHVSLMWKDTIRMCSLAKKHRRRCLIMQRKREMLLLGDSSDHTEAMFINLAIRGMKSYWQTLENSFSTYVDDWLLDLWPVLSPVYASMLTGSTETTRNRIITQTDTLTRQNEWRDSANGYETIWKDINLDDVASLLF